MRLARRLPSWLPTRRSRSELHAASALDFVAMETHLTRLVAAAAALVAAGITGCGSSGAVAVSGPAVFATHCAVCHSISGSPTPHQQGGDLERPRLPRGELLQFAAEMPVLHGRLTARELRAVVSYVQSAERR